ncbi:MAG: aminomethyl-transferring glycine dehydrogenase subunit GcvPA [Clostridiales bacterium]|nr:aminomethyl-transferring glycine dehydrogenase subunit GcvPA [Clostridiales bacterium]
MGSYIPNTLEEQEDMLGLMGMKSSEDLFVQVPKGVRLNSEFNIPLSKSEMEVSNIMTSMAEKNTIFKTIFRGAGAYRHYIPSIVKQITSKEEFITSYTPYQAEISQGVLQSIFEYQTMICELTGMDVSNASVYDGASAAAEAIIMSVERKRNKAIISETVDPQILETVKTYCKSLDIEVVVAGASNGVTNIASIKKLLDEGTACLLIQQPNFYGQLEDAEEIGRLAAEKGAKYIISSNPISLGILKAPAEYGADIAVGEGQPFGIPLSFGGPYLGFMATTEKLMRKLPGRIVGETTDSQGRRAFVLTLQAREQHIRREKASSNICSNQALCAMTAAVYLDAMGEKGLKQAAELSMAKAHYLAQLLCEIDGFDMVYKGEFFNEFVTRSPISVDKLMKILEDRGILGGYPLANDNILWCATEVNTKEEIHKLIDILRRWLYETNL